MNHPRLLRFALAMWAAPLAAASFVLLSFLFLRAEIFVAAGLILLVVGGLCLSAGMIAVMAILTTRNSFAESPRRYYRNRALTVLGLLLLNLPVALAYTLIGGSQIETSAVSTAISPDHRHLAEVIYLGEHDEPEYGQAVSLRENPGWFGHTGRSVMFSGYCLGDPKTEWETPKKLLVTCTAAHDVKRRVARFRSIAIRYRFPPASLPARRGNSR